LNPVKAGQTHQNFQEQPFPRDFLWRLSLILISTSEISDIKFIYGIYLTLNAIDGGFFLKFLYAAISNVPVFQCSSVPVFVAIVVAVVEFFGV
jgi:hypothetical protein